METAWTPCVICSTACLIPQGDLCLVPTPRCKSYVHIVASSVFLPADVFKALNTTTYPLELDLNFFLTFSYINTGLQARDLCRKRVIAAWGTGEAAMAETKHSHSNMRHTASLNKHRAGKHHKTPLSSCTTSQDALIKKICIYSPLTLLNEPRSEWNGQFALQSLRTKYYEQI